MKTTLLFLTLFSFIPAHAYMSHEDIVKQMRGKQTMKASKRTTSGKPVPYEPVDKILKKKKKKKPSKFKKQGAALKRLFGGGDAPTPTPSNTPVASVTPAVSPTPTSSPIAGQGVDRRNCDTPVKSQGSTPRCTAYGTAAGIENLACDHVSLSAAHVWSLYGEAYTESAMTYTPGKFLTTWDYWPANNRNPYTGYLNEAKIKLTKSTYVNGKTIEEDLKLVKEALDKGKMVNVGFSVSSDLASCYAVSRGSAKVTSGGHHVSVVGYKNDPSLPAGHYQILKNSWGADCGDGGYQYFDPSFCGKNGAYCEYYILEGIEKK